MKIFRNSKCYDGIKPEIKEVMTLLSMMHRFRAEWSDAGVLTKAEAEERSAVGPDCQRFRSCSDMRIKDNVGVYGELDSNQSLKSRDCMARTKARIREVLQSILSKRCRWKAPDGPVDVKVPNKVEGECMLRLECEPRGEAFYYSLGAGSKFLKRMAELRTPTNMNVPN